MRFRFLMLFFLTLAAGIEVNAGDCIKNQNGDVVCGEGQCALDQFGQVKCAKQGGGAVRDQYGDVKCGTGYCAKNDLGQIKCSTRPGGGATMDSSGKVQCLGGCKSATRQLCAVTR